MINIEKYLTSSQPDAVNDEIYKLRSKAFKTNSEEDERELLLFLLGAWSEGSLVSRGLADKFSESKEVAPWHDRMGGSFSEEEVLRSQRGGHGW